jgi:hypothetical protein
MALNQSALSELLDALRAGGDLDVLREALTLVLQALIDAEATQHIGARPYERTEPRTATAPARGCCRPRPVMSSCTFPSCARARSSRRCWSPAAASTEPCWPWSWRPTCTAPPPARSTTWSRPWAWSRDLQVGGVPHLRGVGRRGGRVPLSLAGPHQLPVPVPGRHLPQGPRGRPGRQPCGGDRYRGDHRRRPRSPEFGCGRFRGRRLLDGVSAVAQGQRAGRGAAGRLGRPHRPQAGDRGGHGRRRLATLPRPLSQKRARTGA